MAAVFPPDRPNPPDLVPFAEARASVLERLAPLPVREAGLADALGCVLAADVAAAEDLPPFANSAMDGFAVRGADLAGAGEATPVPLRITGEVFAGTGRLPTVEPGGAVRIMTGGALPPGADTVVPVEQTGVEGDTVLVRADPGPAGSSARPARTSAAAPSCWSGDGCWTRPPSACSPRSGARPCPSTPAPGHGRVHRRRAGRPRRPARPRPDPRLQLLAADCPGPLGRGRGVPLRPAPRRPGGPAPRLRPGRRRRRPGPHLRRGVGGDRDYTKQVLAELGDVRSFRVAMQPGMPQAFGFAAGTPLYGLPGNPVSCFVVFETLVRPALRRLAGHPDDRLDRPRVVARLGEPVRSPAGKVSFLRVRLAVGDEGLVAGLTGNQGSGVLSSCVAADGLAVVPAEHRELPEGSPVQVLLLREDLAWVS